MFPKRVRYTGRRNSARTNNKNIYFEPLERRDLFTADILGSPAQTGLLRDVNSDGVVDYSDSPVLSANLEAASGVGVGDFNGNGSTDFSDFLMLSQTFGRTSQPVVGVSEGGEFRQEFLAGEKSRDSYGEILKGDWSGPTASASIGDVAFMIQDTRLHRINADGTWKSLGSSVWEGDVRMTALGDQLYAVENGLLHRIDPRDGGIEVISDQIWDGATSIASSGNHLIIVQNDTLHQVNVGKQRPWSSYRKLDGKWDGPTAAAAIDEVAFVIQDKRLHRISPDGTWKSLGPSVWEGNVQMTALGGQLYAVQNGLLHRVDPLDGGVEVISDQIWRGTTSISSFGEKLIIVQDDTLHQVNVSEQRVWSTYKKLDGNWSGPTAATMVNDEAYVIQSGNLHRVSANGTWKSVGSAKWLGQPRMTELNGRIYVVEHGRLNWIDPRNGNYKPISGAIWHGATSMSSAGDSLIIVQHDRLYRVQVTSTSSKYEELRGNWSGHTTAARVGSDAYVIQDQRLHRVMPNGTWRPLGDRVWHGQAHMTALDGHLYIVQNGYLHEVNPNDGTHQRISDQVWAGTTSVSSTGNRLVIVQNGTLHLVSIRETPWSSYKKLSGDWDGPTASAAIGDEAFVIQDRQLHRVNSEGKTKKLGPRVWKGDVHVTVLGDQLYVVQDGLLHRVDPRDGRIEVISDRIWDTTTSISSSGDRLIIVQNDTLHHVSVNKQRPWSSFKKLNGTWNGRTAATTMGDVPYVIQDQQLHRVNRDGTSTKLGPRVWKGKVHMTALSGHLYVIQDGRLHRVNAKDGSIELISPKIWDKATSITTSAGKLLVVNSGTLHKVAWDAAIKEATPLARAYALSLRGTAQFKTLDAEIRYALKQLFREDYTKLRRHLEDALQELSDKTPAEIGQWFTFVMYATDDFAKGDPTWASQKVEDGEFWSAVVPQVQQNLSDLAESRGYDRFDSRTKGVIVYDPDPIRLHLHAYGTDANDQVLIKERGDSLTITLSYETRAYQRTYPKAAVDEIFGQLFDGDDHFVNDSSIPAFVNAAGGDDYLSGGSGDDSLGGAEGNDVIIGGDGNDTLNGNDGSDLLVGGRGDDEIIDAKTVRSGNGLALTGSETSGFRNVSIDAYGKAKISVKAEESIIVGGEKGGKIKAARNAKVLARYDVDKSQLKDLDTKRLAQDQFDLHLSRLLVEHYIERTEQSLKEIRQSKIETVTDLVQLRNDMEQRHQLRSNQHWQNFKEVVLAHALPFEILEIDGVSTPQIVPTGGGVADDIGDLAKRVGGTAGTVLNVAGVAARVYPFARTGYEIGQSLAIEAKNIPLDIVEYSQLGLMVADLFGLHFRQSMNSMLLQILKNSRQQILNELDHFADTWHNSPETQVTGGQNVLPDAAGIETRSEREEREEPEKQTFTASGSVSYSGRIGGNYYYRVRLQISGVSPRSLTVWTGHDDSVFSDFANREGWDVSEVDFDDPWSRAFGTGVYGNELVFLDVRTSSALDPQGWSTLYLVLQHDDGHTEKLSLRR